MVMEEDTILPFFSCGKHMIPEHDCLKNVGFNCRCKICGKVCHDYQSNGDGTFAVSGKVATMWCARCGKRERLYSDSGVLIETDFDENGE